MQPSEMIQLQLRPMELEKIIQCLLEMPYKVAAPILQTLNAQIEVHNQRVQLAHPNAKPNGSGAAPDVNAPDGPR